MGKERLIEILNDLVSVEIAAVTEYQQHSYLSDNARVTDLLEDFSMDEMSHIEWCSKEVVRLGGIPTVIPKEIKHAEKNFEELMRRDIEVEAEAMRRLRGYIEVAEEEGDNGIKRLLKEIYADEETHYEILKRIVNPPKYLFEKIRTNIDIGTGMILTGLFWLYVWAFPWFIFYEMDPRWAHNFAYPIIVVTIGVAYKAQKMSVDLMALISSFLIIPIESGIISGTEGTYTAVALLLTVMILLVFETGRRQELLFLRHRWRRWLKKHLLTFVFLLLMHMAFIYFFMRVLTPEFMSVNLPPEPISQREHWSTASYNILVIPFALIGMAERFRGSLRRRMTISKFGYWWSLMIIIVGLAIVVISEMSYVGLASRSLWRFLGPLIVAIVILIVSVIAYRKK